MQELFLNIHHIEEHQASMFILLLLSKFLETVFLVEGNGRKIGIDGNIAECRLILSYIKTIFQHIHQPSTDILSAIVCGHRKATNFDAWITAELFAYRKAGLNLFPAATRNFTAANAVVQQTEISSNTSIVLKDECVGDSQFVSLLGIAEKKFIPRS